MERKRIMIAVIACCMLFMHTAVCMAAEELFFYADVDSNSFTPIISAQKDSYGEVGTVYINKIHTANGGASLYSTVHCRATIYGEDEPVTKGQSVNLALPVGYREAGNHVQLQAKGNTPYLDCQITGYWNVH